MLKNNQSIVQTNRIRLARNINGFSFPEWSSHEDLHQIKQMVKKSSSKIKADLKYQELASVKDAQRNLLVEENILNSNFIKGDASSKAFAYNTNGTALLINEEDHIRISYTEKGFDLEKSWDKINKIDTNLSEELEFSFSQELGFATACPSNIGTGMRASVMVHLPGLCLDGKIANIISNLNDSFITVRGLYGEGSMALGHFFQVSNLNTLGVSETETIKYLKKVIESITKKEINSRKNLLKKNNFLLKDKVGRAIGILNHAYYLSYEEALDLISIIFLGERLGITKKVKSLKNLSNLSKQLRDGHLKKHYKNRKKKDDPKQIEIFRAEFIRELVS